MEDLRLRLEGEFHHVHHADEGGLDRLHGVALVVDRRGRAGEVVDFVELAPERLRHVMEDEGEAAVGQQVVDVRLGAGEEVVEDRHLVAFVEKAFREMRADEAGAAGDERFFNHDANSIRIGEPFGKRKMSECAGNVRFDLPCGPNLGILCKW